MKAVVTNLKTLTILVLSISLTIVVALIGGCVGKGEVTDRQKVTFDQLFSNPEEYHGRYITLEGFYFHGFEVIVLSEDLRYSGYAEGHLIPQGKMLWIEGGIPQEIYNQLYQQQMMGPTERYGKIRVKGKFEYGGQYGHLGQYNYQITPSEVELISWVPPANRGEK